MAIRATIQDESILRNGGRDATEAAARALARFTGGVLKFGKAEWQRRSRKDTGGFIRSIFYRVTRRGTKVTGVLGSDASEVIQRVMESGRRPGAPMPPPGALLDWLHRHGIDPKAEYPIRRAIARKGIPGTHAQAQAFNRVKGLFEGAGLRAEVVDEVSRRG